MHLDSKVSNEPSTNLNKDSIDSIDSHDSNPHDSHFDLSKSAKLHESNLDSSLRAMHYAQNDDRVVDSKDSPIDSKDLLESTTNPNANQK